MITLDEMKNIMLNICDDLVLREDELCNLDSFVGDGDHGTTVKKAFTNIKKKLETNENKDLGEMFMSCATAISEVMGGAIGPIFSSIFWGMSSDSVGKTLLETKDIYSMLNSGLEKVMYIGGAKPGDKTLVDSMYAAVKTLERSLDLSEKEALRNAAKSAYEGAQNTKDLVSQKGRSHFLNEASKGYVDAGSMTMYYFIKTFADSV